MTKSVICLGFHVSDDAIGYLGVAEKAVFVRCILYGLAKTLLGNSFASSASKISLVNII